MKVQLQPGRLRLRIDEAELATLLGGESIRLTLVHGPGIHWTYTLALAAALDAVDLAAPAPARVSIRLPHGAVQAYAATLPRRDALTFEIGREGQGGDALTRIDFEVDVRDSIRTRGAARSS
ncbi:hypothetical protein [Cognatilysobacter bugurensis]|uniref:Uncharacterized protein n=1 Tax=Cognatilysobacter bugurensis TaxID=543356 RepID=A0A918SV78_9GAMM|nr:hypothetical protein [Lysobacter bugurensis]GHA73031.1 hypothetical protein GCM10007067_07080 [Lysobacter bugurensis]